MSNKMDKEFKHILIVHAGGIGDLVMLTPFLQVLRQHFTGSKIDLFVGYSSGAAEVLKGSEIIDKIFDFSFPNNNCFKKIAFISKLRQERYDLAIVTSGINPFKGSLFVFLIGAKTRIGEYTKSKLTFYTRKIKLDGNTHKTRANMELLKLLDINRISAPPMIFPVDDGDKKSAEEFFIKNGLNKKIVVGFSISSGARQRFKDWGKESFIKLGQQILDKIPNSFILIFGSFDEETSCAEINGTLYGGSLKVVGLPLKQVAAMIGKCRIFVAPDGGLAHIASTTNTDLVPIFGPTVYERTGPLGSRVHVVRAACDHPYHDIFTKKYNFNESHLCLKKITPDMIFQKIKEIL